MLKQPEFVTAAYLADYLQLPSRAVHRLAREGVFPSYRLGHRTVRFRLREVLDAMESAESSTL